MRVVQDRAEARWLPSRFGFALARLMAFAILRGAKPQPAPGLRLVVQREQVAIEQYVIAVWVVLTTTAYLAAVLARAMAWPAAAIVAAVTAPFVIELPYLLLGAFLLPFRHGNNQKFLSTACMVLLFVASAYFATVATPVRFVAYFALAVFALNAVAAVAMFALRGPVRRLEERCGA